MKTALILGSNSDVGQACAYQFAENGFNIILASRNTDDYQNKLASDLSIKNDVDAKPVQFNALDYAGHKAFFDSLSIVPDVVISVFGYLGNHTKALKDFSEANQIMSTNLIGNVSILNVIAEAMVSKGLGAIICVSSVAGERGRQSNYIYGSSKAGLTAYLSGLRNHLTKRGIQVCTVIPGFIKTKMIQDIDTPKLLTATPQQVAKAIWKAYYRKTNVVYVLPVWRPLMFAIRGIPESIFKKLSL